MSRMMLARALLVALPFAAWFAWTWWAARRAGWALWPGRPRWSPDLSRLLRVAGPAVLAGGVVQINLLVGRQVASFFEGAVAWLSYADRNGVPRGLAALLASRQRAETCGR